MCKHTVESTTLHTIKLAVKYVNQAWLSGEIDFNEYKKHKAIILSQVVLSHRDVIANLFIY